MKASNAGARPRNSVVGLKLTGAGTGIAQTIRNPGLKLPHVHTSNTLNTLYDVCKEGIKEGINENFGNALTTVENTFSGERSVFGKAISAVSTAAGLFGANAENVEACLDAISTGNKTQIFSGCIGLLNEAMTVVSDDDVQALTEMQKNQDNNMNFNDQNFNDQNYNVSY